MTAFITARPIYTRREVPKDPAQLSAWLATELSNVQRAILPQRSRTVLADGPIKTTDTIVYADAAAAAITLVLPQPNQAKDLMVTVKKIDASGNSITIRGTVDGVVNPVLAAQFNAITLHTDGLTYYTLASV